MHGAVAVVADGVGGAKGGRVAAESAVRSVIDGVLGQSEALPVRRTAGVAITAINSWIHALGRSDPALAGMACTLTAIILRGQRMHVFHVGDTRLYRMRNDELELLTTDHVLGRPGVSHALTRAIGAEDEVRVDYGEYAARTACTGCCPMRRCRRCCADGKHRMRRRSGWWMQRCRARWAIMRRRW
jgi:serine/threonine protein phosphatase PrpC